MASFTELVGGSAVNPATGTHLALVTVPEGSTTTAGSYLSIANVSSGANPDVDADDYDANFANTLYFITS